MKLYRYEAPEPSRISTLMDRKIWMASLDSFNDPFDGKHEYFSGDDNFLFSNDELVDLAKYLYAEQNKRINYYPSKTWIYSDRCLRAINDWLNQSYDGDCLHVAYSSKDLMTEIISELKSYTASCFNSEGPSSLLMWAYYAHSHRGFCVEYEANLVEISCDEKGFLMAPMIYTNKRPTFDLRDALLSPDKLGTAFFYTKGSSWAWEQEYRLLKFKSSFARSVCIPRGLSVSAIYEGINTNEDISEKLYSCAKELNVDLYKMYVSDFDYSLFTELRYKAQKTSNTG